MDISLPHLSRKVFLKDGFWGGLEIFRCQKVQLTSLDMPWKCDTQENSTFSADNHYIRFPSVWMLNLVFILCVSCKWQNTNMIAHIIYMAMVVLAINSGSYTSDFYSIQECCTLLLFCSHLRGWVWIFPLGHEYQYSIQSYKSCDINSLWHTQKAIHILR